MHRSLILCFLLLVAGAAHAKNISANAYSFNDNDTIPIALSYLNVNRLVVKGDAIASLSCPLSFCTSDSNPDDRSGSVALKINVRLPFTAHVSTVGGHNFTLFISPKATPAIVSEFVALNDYQKEPTVFDDKDFDYPMALAQFTKQMITHQHNDSLIKGFSLHEVDPKTLPKDTAPLAVIPKKIFRGVHYSGIIYEVVNQTDKPQTLTNAQFYSFSARSASLDRYRLAPSEKATLYIVTGERR
ncbi:type-F conjugative transfer system secretin TraK [Vibrio lentus]